MKIDRYHRQVLLPQVGPEGQARLAAARVLVVGCGALGSVMADQLVRGGVGRLLIADRDVVELTNLQRQVLFTEDDVRDQTPKAAAAARALGRINSAVRIEPIVADVHGGNIEAIAGLEAGAEPVDLILDGTDNVASRYLMNDVAVKHGVPWVYGACVGTEGRCFAIRPPDGACLRCLFPKPPAAAELPTCDTAGVLASAAAVVASLAVTAALRILLAAPVTQPEPLICADVWQGRFKTLSTEGAKDSACIACGQRRFEFLDGPAAGSVSLCGRNAVQVRGDRALTLDLSRIAGKLGGAGSVQQTRYLVRCQLHEPVGIDLTIFPDGRAIVHGTGDLERARSIYARFVGN